MKYTTIFSQCCNIAGTYKYLCTVYYCTSRFPEQKCCGRYKWWCQAFSLAPAHTRTAGGAYETTEDVYWCCGIVKKVTAAVEEQKALKHEQAKKISMVSVTTEERVDWYTMKSFHSTQVWRISL